MGKKKKRTAFESALFHYAMEHEGRHMGVRIAGRTIHTVECQALRGLPLDGDDRGELLGYRVRAANAAGDWEERDFTSDGRLSYQRSGRQLDS